CARWEDWDGPGMDYW
nr:immunoglobulin heavy chain junction region [Mus musculus]NSM06896.1 immunoglobulin heavy chain junction region [Mus musculus]